LSTWMFIWSQIALKSSRFVDTVLPCAFFIFQLD
jgi:hypothetical protein